MTVVGRHRNVKLRVVDDDDDRWRMVVVPQSMAQNASGHAARTAPVSGCIAVINDANLSVVSKHANRMCRLYGTVLGYSALQLFVFSPLARGYWIAKFSPIFCDAREPCFNHPL